MGTRHLITVKRKGKTVVAQYGQFDGYLSCCGKGVVDFIKRMDTRKFNKALDNCRFLTSDEIAAKYKAEGINGEWMTMDEAERFNTKYPELARETSYDVLDMIYKGKATELGDNSDFAKDGLFCEWAYEINMDKRTLTVYTNGTQLYGRVSFADCKNGTAYKYLKNLDTDEDVA